MNTCSNVWLLPQREEVSPSRLLAPTQQQVDAEPYVLMEAW